ncbi:MAG: VWA domain-containing protein [Chromatiales bacterium]|jgi:nitric oxide reductase NorD protein
MEEQVGQFWHRFITRLADATHADARVRLADVKHRLAIYFRALGGDAGLQIDIADNSQIKVRRSWLQRIAGSGKKVQHSWRDDSALRMPAEIAWFDAAQLNRDLYYWLAALAAVAGSSGDMNWLLHNQLSTMATLQQYPGLKKRYVRLVAAHIEQRPDPAGLPAEEQAIESQIRQALQHPGSVQDVSVLELETSYDFHPVPLWLLHKSASASNYSWSDDDAEQAADLAKVNSRELEDVGKRQAEQAEEPEDNRGLITIRMENILTTGEFINLDRGNEEEDDLDQAESVARDLDKITLSRNRKSLGSRLKFDLDLPSVSEDDVVLQEGLLLPEWDWKKQQMIADCCRVVELVSRGDESAELPQHLSRPAKRLRNQFQALAPARVWQPRQQDGPEIDLDAYLRYMSDRRAGHDAGADRLYRELRRGARDLSCLLLADLSLSTDSWIDDHHRIIDVIRDSLYLFAESLHATGDRFSMYGFSSRKRDPIRLHRLKDFAENYNGEIRGRIAQIAPGYYTRLGAGIRFATEKLLLQSEGRRLLLILTDGKPNDLDKYEGRFGIEDTRQAVLAARRAGLQPFCVTIDRKGNEYLPHLFGSNGYVVIKRPTELPKKLPLLYAKLSA